MPDTFQSWFLVAHLHVWLCLVRLKREGRDGELVIQNVVSIFWYDVQQRMQVLGVSRMAAAQHCMSRWHNHTKVVYQVLVYVTIVTWYSIFLIEHSCPCSKLYLGHTILIVVRDKGKHSICTCMKCRK